MESVLLHTCTPADLFLPPVWLCVYIGGSGAQLEHNAPGLANRDPFWWSWSFICSIWSCVHVSHDCAVEGAFVLASLKTRCTLWYVSNIKNMLMPYSTTMDVDRLFLFQLNSLAATEQLYASQKQHITSSGHVSSCCPVISPSIFIQH